MVVVSRWLWYGAWLAFHCGVDNYEENGINRLVSNYTFRHMAALSAAVEEIKILAMIVFSEL